MVAKNLTINNWLKSPGITVYAIYSLLSLVVLLPILTPGYILTLDMIFVPYPPLPDEVTSSYLFHAMLHFLSYAIPSDILQKIILFGILFGSGVGAHKLAKYLFSERQREHTDIKTGHIWQLAAYFAGIFYVLNPFTYGRFMAGQYAVLLGYMLLPFFALALLKFLKTPSWRSLWPLTTLTLVISIVSLHTLGMAIVFLIVATIVAAWRSKKKRNYLLTLLGRGIIGVISVLLLSAYWFVPLVMGQGRVAEQIDNFSHIDRAAFAADGGLFNILQLQGFWVEAQGLFKPVGEPLPLSGFIQLAVWILVLIGFISLWRRQRHVAITFGAIAVIATIVALGEPVNNWLAEHLPLFAGYREPHKFVSLLALSFAIFGAYGVAVLLQRIAKLANQAIYILVAIALLSLPFLNTPAMLWGFNGQLAPRQYPADWYTQRQQLSQIHSDQYTLFLPWHLYMPFGFSGGRIIANPAEKFFNANVITSDDPEFAGLAPSLGNNLKTILGKEILPKAPDTEHLGSELRSLGIEYVLLAKAHDYKSYSYLDHQQDIKLVQESPNLKLYRIISPLKEDGNANN